MSSSASSAGLGADRVGDAGQRHRAGVAVEQRDAVQEERRGERAEQEVLERRLLGEQPPAAGQPAQQVERQREHLERDEHRQQVVGGREQQHAADREHQQREDLGLGDAGRGERAARAREPGMDEPAGAKTPPVVGRAARRRSGRRGSRAAGSCPAGTAPGRRWRPRPSAAICVLAGQRRRRRRTPRPGPPSASPSWVSCRQVAAHERLDEHADHGDAEDDQHRHQQPVLDGRRRRTSRRATVDPVTAQLPSAAGTSGAGSLDPDLLHGAVDRRVDDVEQRLREEAERDDHRDQRGDHPRLADVQVGAASRCARWAGRSSSAGTSAGCRARPGRCRGSR